MNIYAQMDNIYFDALAKGERIGLGKGKTQAQTQIASSMLQSGIDIETIAKCTGLSVEKVKTLQK